MFEEFKREEAERRKEEFDVYRKASEKESQQREEFLSLFRSFVGQRTRKRKRREERSSESD